MGYKCSFMDNETYTAQDVNEAIGRIAGDGAAFSDAGSTLADFNAALAGIVGSGTQLCGCCVTKSGDTYKIGVGTCFMSDGSQITFDNEGHIIEPIGDTKTYVYLKRNEAANTIDIVVSATAASGDFVPLAEIAADGSITDTRKFASAKVMLKAGQNTPSRSYTVTQTYAGTKTIETGFSGWRYILLHNRYVVSGNASDTDAQYFAVDLTDGKSHGIPWGNNQNTAQGATVTKNGSQLTLTWSNGIDLTFEVR